MERIKLFRSYPSACNYIEGNENANLIIDPEASMDAAQYEMLLEKGFRRSGSMVYRPDCDLCSACVPTRIPVNAFAPRRNQRRCLRKNEDINVRLSPAIFSQEVFELYNRYLNIQHPDGGMANPTEQAFKDFLCQQSEMAIFVELRDKDDALLCVACTDQLPGSLSAVYTWYEPAQAHRSLGMLAILKQIELAQASGKEFLYLGYWIESVRKMTYKTDYRPYQLLLDGHWKTPPA